MADKKYIAKHLIPLTVAPGKAGDKAKGIAPVKPKVKEITPGERVMMDPEDETTKFLLEQGALELAPTDDAKAVTKTTEPAKKTSAPAKKTTASKTTASKKDEGSSDDGSDLV